MTFNWNYMLSLLSDVDFWQATWTVIKLSLLTWAFSIVLGFILALAKQSPRKLFNAPARLYIWLFRSMPLLVLLIFVYNMPQAARLRPGAERPVLGRTAGDGAERSRLYC
jgi:polar amino acid transport system permease protein